jgi:hypothetical protein
MNDPHALPKRRPGTHLHPELRIEPDKEKKEFIVPRVPFSPRRWIVLAVIACAVSYTVGAASAAPPETPPPTAYPTVCATRH